jgi:uncharacterized damage-inducible protein DinB
VYGSRELAASFRTVRNNTIQIAEDIPEDKYDFVPAPGVMSVSETLRHLAYATILHFDFHRDRRITTLQGYDFGALIVRIRAEEKQPKTKAEIVATLKQTADEFETWLASLSSEFLAETFTDVMGQNPKTRLEQLLGAKEHEMHHRGQLMLMQRMIGIVPHLTRRREEQMRARSQATATA